MRSVSSMPSKPSAAVAVHDAGEVGRVIEHEGAPIVGRQLVTESGGQQGPSLLVELDQDFGPECHRTSPPGSRRRCPTRLRHPLHGIQWDIMGYPGKQYLKTGFGEESEGRYAHYLLCAASISNARRRGRGWWKTRQNRASRRCRCHRHHKPSHQIGKPDENAGQTACKPGSVPAVKRWMAIPLGRPLPNASRDRPGRRRGNTAAGCPACRPYLVLLPVGFAVPLPLPVARWALTPPFHPCLTVAAEAGQPGGLFSVALSLGSPPPAVNRHRVSVEPGLSSPSRLPGSAAIQPSDLRGLARPLPPAGQAGRPAAPASRDRPCRRPGPAGNGAGRPSRSPAAARRSAARSRSAAARRDVRRTAAGRRPSATGRCRHRRASPTGSAGRDRSCAAGAMSEWPTTLRGSIAG